MGLTKAIAEIAKSQETLYPFVFGQSTQAMNDRRIYGKKFTQAFS